jgi:predicted nucleic acid-binding protein
MTVKVVDASALAALLFGEPDAEAIEARLRNAILVAPRLIEYELGNTCRKKCHRHPEVAPLLTANLQLLEELDLQMHDVDYVSVLDLAEHAIVSYYDASYLWLARQLGAELVTLDGRLRSVK